MDKLVVILTFCIAAAGQTSETGLEFEVASIKVRPSPPNGVRFEGQQIGGPGTKDPTMYRCLDCNLGRLVRTAFDLKTRQFDPPDWTWYQQLDLLARVPIGATKEQVLLMLQALLKERFHLAYHFEKKEVDGFQMSIAKNGPKLQESAEDPPVAEGGAVPAAPAKVAIGKDGFPARIGVSRMRTGNKLWVKKQTMDQFATWLASQAAGRPVVNATGLSGTYDITLYWGPNARRETSAANADGSPLAPLAAEGPTLLSAMQSQLGLKLEPNKLTIDVFVIDHIDKTPTEN